MSIYVDKVHIYCDHENCDNEAMIENEEMGSNDLGESGSSWVDAISDYAFNQGWYIDPFNNKVSCPTHDKN